MPWRETSPMEERIRFVKDCRSGLDEIAPGLARGAGVGDRLAGGVAAQAPNDLWTTDLSPRCGILLGSDGAAKPAPAGPRGARFLDIRVQVSSP